MTRTRSLADVVRALLGRVWRRPSAAGPEGRPLATSEATADMFEAPEDGVARTDVEALRLLLWRLAASNQGQTRVADDIESTAARISTADLARVDETVRPQWTRHQREAVWITMTPARATTVARELGDRVRAISLLALHPNGHVREAVLRELSTRTDGRELPVLALRANDWVDPVASLAGSLLASRLTPANQPEVLGALPFLVRMLAQRRRDHAALASALRATLDAEGGAGVFARFASLDRPSRLFVWQQFAAQATASDSAIVRLALADPDPGLRERGVAALAHSADLHETVRVLEHIATSDRSARVRRQALAVLAERSPARAIASLRRTLLDPSAGVRHLAQFLVRRLGAPIDPRAIYVDAIEHDRRTTVLMGAVAGLADVGNADDAPRVEACFPSLAPRARRVVLRALARLTPDRAVALALTAMTDPVRRVRGAALRVIASHTPRTEAGTIVEQLWTHRDTEVRLAALRLSSHAPKWRALALRLDATADPTPTVAALAVRLVEDWLADFNRLQTPPTEEELRLARARAATHGPRLSPETRRLLEFTLSVVG